MADTARIDKWLWAARVYKTRSLAANACKNGRVTIEGVNVKPSHMIKRGEVISVKKPPITYSYMVLDCIEQRFCGQSKGYWSPYQERAKSS